MHHNEPYQNTVLDRRLFLGKIAVAGIGAAAFGLGGTARASLLSETVDLDFIVAPTYDGAPVTTALGWSKAIFPTVHLSYLTTEIAKKKAQNAKVIEFAGFEYGETRAVTKIEMDMGMPIPPKTPKSEHILAMLHSSTGSDFDIAFTKAQQTAHAFLVQVTSSFLSTPGDLSDPAEAAGRHLALLSLQFFKEHFQLTADILGELASS